MIILEPIMSDVKEYKNFKDLAPMIMRKRLIIEGTTNQSIHGFEIKNYLNELSKVMNMTIVSHPTIQWDDAYGYSGYVCWKESGSHMYSWKETDERPDFFSVDIYTCKDFQVEDVIEFTKLHLKGNLKEITWRQ
jgi:S-adenosylmethionine/arginine decarboxylase-like enzyme